MQLTTEKLESWKHRKVRKIYKEKLKKLQKVVISL